ncbi:MAG TPA: hypothetical protein VIO32_07580 [Candidatus Baltobacteraceae bacterium]
MSTRKQFIAAAASVPLIAAAAPAPQPAPASTPTPSPKPRQISQAAKALAEQMRAFDANLTDKQLEEIAAGIDDNLKTGARVNPHGTYLKNWNEPVTVFEVPSVRQAHHDK